MKLDLRRLAAGVLGVCVVAFAAPALAAPPETFPLSQVKRGQTGYGLSTFAGTKPERWTFEVVSVVTNMLPHQDIILVKSSDTKVTTPGFWRGMSGSPLFIDDKLVCAFSYGWAFNKQALGGCTPIDYMKKEGLQATPRGGGPGTGAGTPQPIARAVATTSDWHAFAPSGDVGDGLAALGPARSSWLLQAPTPPRLANAPLLANGMPQPEDVMTAAVPLSLAGFSPPAFAELSQLFAGYDLVPVRASGTGGGATGPTAFELGGAIAVQLIRGDMAASATGTVSFLEGPRVLAFGHPMFEAGEFYAPVAIAEVHTVIPSAQFPFVMASPRREVGSLVLDRQSMIMADTRLRNPMIPMDIFVTTSDPGGKGATTTGEFHVEILDNKFWTAQLAFSAAGNAVNYFLPDRDDVTIKVDSLLKIKGHGDVRFTDYLYANDGAGSVMGGVRGLRALVPLQLNPFATVEIERMEMRVDLRFDANYGEIKEVILPSALLPPGKRSMLKVVMSTYGDREVTEEVAVDVPASAAGAVLQLELTAGDAARLDSTSPTSLPDLIAVLRQMRAGNVWVATLYEPGDGIAVDGRRVRDVPGVVADRLRPGSRTQRAELYRPLSQTVTPASRVIVGGVPMMLQIADK